MRCCRDEVSPNLWLQAVALRETQLRKLVDDLDAFVHSSALTTAAWLAQIDALIFPQRWSPCTWLCVSCTPTALVQ